MNCIRIIWVSLLIPMCLFGKGHIDRFSTLPTCTAETDSAIDAKGLEKAFPDHDAVYLERITDFENVIVESENTGYDWNLIHTEYKKLLILNPENTEYSTLSIEVPVNHVLDKARFSVWTPGQGFQTFDRSDLIESRDSDGSAVYKFAFPSVIKGSVITQSYAVRQLYCFRDAPLDYQVALQFEVPCQKASFRLVYPLGWEMAVKKIADGRALPVSIVKDKKLDQSIMSYSVENVPAVQREPFSPFYKELAIYAEIQVINLNMRISGWWPIKYKAPKDWEELSERCKDYVLKKDPIFSARVVEKTIEITRSCASDFEKLDAIISWLQLNMRVANYLENKASGMNQANFADNLQRQQGSAAQITGLALSMLQNINIDSKFLLIHTAKDGYFDPGFFSYSQMAIPAVWAKIDNKVYVVFPYRWRMPVDHVPEEFQGQKAMAIQPSGKYEFILLPLGNQSENETLESYNLTFAENGKIKVEDERIFQGSSAYSMRLELAGLSQREIETELKRLITFSDAKIDLKSHAVLDQQEYKKPLKIKMEYEIDNLLSITPEEVIFNSSELFTAISRIKTKDLANDRQNAIRIYFDETVKKTITINHPDVWSVSTKLNDFKHENQFGSVQGTYRASQGLLTGEQTLILKKASAPRESYPDLQSLVGKKTPHSVPAIIFSRKK